MYNSQIVKERINDTIKKNKTSATKVLADCELSPNTINQMSDNKGLSSFSLAKIADYLNVSVDYLLGRTDEPKTINQNNVVNVSNSGDNNTNNVNIGKASSEDISEITEMIKKLSLIERSKVILFIEEMKGNQ